MVEHFLLASLTGKVPKSVYPFTNKEPKFVYAAFYYFKRVYSEIITSNSLFLDENAKILQEYKGKSKENMNQLLTKCTTSN